jgi:translation initiation factor IF-1
VASEDAIVVEGLVVEVIRAGLFRMELSNGYRFLAHGTRRTQEQLKGVVPGDRLAVEMSPFDLSKGRIRLSEK